MHDAERLRRELLQWMEEHEYDSIRQMQGSMSRKAVAHPEAFERANYMGSYPKSVRAEGGSEVLFLQ
jgi:hypothetical protein